MQTDEIFMARALELARKGQGFVLPNPMVGAVIVKDGRIIGEGWHAADGDLHAEAAALENTSESPRGSTLYVTLEPCWHSGEGKRQPPCTGVILAAGISRVVAARRDPNPRVSGKALALLRNRGVKVACGVLEPEAARLNRVYETLVMTDRPFVHLKAALTLDGFLAAADGSSRWISSKESRRRVMEFRSQSDAVLTGKGTLFTDSPSLTVRDSRKQEVPGAQPLRVFLCSRGELPGDWDRIGGDVLVYHDESQTVSAPVKRNTHIRFCGVKSSDRGLSLSHVFSDLRSQGVYSLLVEGGSRLFGSILRRGLWDRLSVFVAPVLLGEGVPLFDGLGIRSLSEKLELQDSASTPSGCDVMIDGYREALPCSRG